MKGKGKSQDKDCPLLFPDLECIDHVKLCPRYTAVLSRGEGESIGLEELDGIQVDLETLLNSVGKRLKVLENEIQILQNWQEKNGDIKPLQKAKGGKVQPETPGKRGKGADEKPCKKFKDSAGKPIIPVATKLKTKIGQIKVPEFDRVDSPPVEISKLPKNNAVNKFWASVEPYCADITQENLKFLEDLLRSHEDDSEYLKVPPLGMHYSEKWAEEDMMEEQKQGAKISDKRSNGITPESNGASGLLKTADAGLHDESPFGPLTQRLVSALIEENIMAPIDDDMDTDYTENETLNESAAISPKELAKQLNLGNTAHLEKRIKRELEEQGILDFDDDEEDDENDEILRELRAKQAELRDICAHNLQATKRLYKLAREEIDQQELRRKLSTSDTEVMEAYRKIQLAKQKKKTPTKKERETVMKVLKDREPIVKALDI